MLPLGLLVNQKAFPWKSETLSMAQDGRSRSAKSIIIQIMNNRKSDPQDESVVQSQIVDNTSKVVKNQSQLTEEQKQNNMEQFKKFLNETGISDAFQVIFAEIIDKKIKEEESYKYTADRLREIGKGLSTELTRAKQDLQKKELASKMRKK